MAQSVEQLKQEISEQYIKDFKKELGGMKSLVLFPIENKVKKILTGEINLPNKFDEVEEFGWRKNIINFVTPDTALKIFNFMKEKRLEIEKRKTEEDLLNLKNEILGFGAQSNQSLSQNDNQQQQMGQSETQTETQIGIQSDTQTETQQQEQETEEKKGDTSGTSSVISGAIASGTGFGVTMSMGKISESVNYKHLSEGINSEKIKGTINAGIDALKKQRKLENRLSSHQLKSIDKHIEKLEQGLKEVGDDDIELLKLWGELDNKLPKELVRGAGISQKQMLALEKIADQLVECKNMDEMKTLLRNNNVTGISDEVLLALKNADNVTELKKMTKILRYGSRVNRFIQTLAGAMLIDVACLGLDVWVYLETKKEAELIAKVNEVRAENKRSQANRQLGIGIGSVLVEGGIITACVLTGTSTGGPLGAIIGLAVGAVATAASMGADSLYFDVQDFYLQNKEDFIREKKSKINQAILQGLHNKKHGNISLNEKVGAPDSKEKEQSLYDACWSMIFLDEIQDGKFSDYAPFYEYIQSGKSKEDYIKGLKEDQKTQFEEKWKEIEAQIKLRMEYIEKVFKGDKIIRDLKEGKGMDSINNLFTKSRIYGEMKSESKWDEKINFDTNLRRYKSEYFSEFSGEKLDKLEKIKQENLLLFQELMTTASLTSLLLEDEGNSNYTENVKLVKKYQDWLKLTQTDKEKITMEIPDSHKNVNFVEKLLKADFDITKVTFGSMDKERLIDIVGLNEERYGEIETSDDPFQNTLYRLAKELFGYTGKNTKEGVMEFYSEADGNVHGIYYKDAWLINNDWAKDSDVKGAVGKGKVFNSQAEIDAYVNSFMAKNMNGDSIDTATEAIDNYLQKEFEDRFRAILKEELSHRTKQNQEKIKKDITDFVKLQSKNDEYIELPYYILIQARKAGLGDLQRQFFRWKDGKLEVCLLPSELSNNTLDAKTTYLSPAREEFTEEEKVYIDRVERAHADVENIRALGGTGFLTDTFTDELDLPKEIEIIISDKYKEWEKFKSDMMMYSADSVSRIGIYEKYKEFAEYFENLYRGILIALTTYSMSNDVDTYALFSQALAFGNGDYIDEKGALKEDVDVAFLKEPKLREFYNDQISTQKVGGKTVQELWNSEKGEERELALLASQQILTAILEQSMLSKDDKGKVTKIHIGGHWFDSDKNDGYKDQKSKTEEKIKEKLLKLKPFPVFDKSKIEKLMKHQTIKKLKGQEQKIIKEISNLQQKIEETRNNIVWQGKRGDLVYNPEKGTLRSWGKTVKVEEKNGKYYIESLDISFSNLKEMLRIANFRNRAKAKFSGKEIEYDRDLFNSSVSLRYSFVAKESWPKSDTLLIARGDLESYCPSCKSDDLVRKIAKRLNSELN